MYEDLFGLNRRPFSSTPCADDFVAIAPMQDALDSLVHCITQSRGVAIVTSAPGLGKTMLCKRLAFLLQQNFRSTFLSAAGLENRLGLLQAILFEWNLSYVGLSEQEARLKIFETARQRHEEGINSLLIIDEAHQLSPRLLEELRTLAEYAPDGTNLIHVVLCGAFELEENLADPALSAFNQRIGLQICLNPLSLHDSARVIAERFRACGAEDVLSVLTEEALELICRASDGNLRCLTQLADHACLMAYAEEKRPVDADTVRAALEDLKELPLLWNDIPGEAADEEPILSTGENVTEEPSPPIAPIPSHDPGASQRLKPSDLDTDEFPIPEFLRIDTPSTTVPESTIKAESSVTQEEEASTESDPRCSFEDAEFAIFETGADLEDGSGVLVEATPHQETPEEPPANVDSEPEQSDSYDNPPSLAFDSEQFAPISEDSTSSEMIESPVIDRYTLLDRMMELPEDRRAEIDLSILEEISSVDSQTEDQTKCHDCTEPEAAVLDMVEQIRRDLQKRPQSTSGESSNLHRELQTSAPAFQTFAREPSPVTENHPQPSAAPVSTEPSQSQSAQPERRYAQLFTRLRLRRQKAEARK